MLIYLRSLTVKGKIYSGLIILSIATILLSLQIVWIQNNIYNDWLTPFDRLWFRLPATLIISFIAGLFYTGFWLGFVRKRLGIPEEKAIRRLSIVHLPLLLASLMPFRIELLYIDFFNNAIFFIAIASFFVLLEAFFIIPAALKNFGAKIKPVLVPALFFALTLLFFAPLQIYLTNQREFFFSLDRLFALTLLVFGAGFLVLIQILLIIPGRPARIFSSIIFAFALSLWLQGNILGWKYGVLDGSAIDWNKKVVYGIIDTGIWTALTIFCIVFSSRIAGYINRISLFFVLLQIVVFSVFIFVKARDETKIKEPSFRRYSVDETGKFEYSGSTNVIILVVDEFQSDIFREIVNEKPEYGSVFDGFTYFRNSLSAFPFTTLAIPSILTGEFYDNTIPIEKFVEDKFLSNSILKTLRENGFDVEAYPMENDTVYYSDSIMSNIRKRGQPVEVVKELSYLYDVALFYYLPHFIKPHIYNNSDWFLFSLMNKMTIKKYAYQVHSGKFYFNFIY